MRWILLLGIGCAAPLEPAVDVLLEVDPFIGSGGGGYAQGQAFVGAQMPFGFARPGPDTSGPLLGDLGFAHASGYWYPDDTIEGFGNVHLHGTGVEDYGLVRLMPTLGMSAAKTDERGYRQKFRHRTERASPGYYSVLLDDTGTRVELTATVHGAVHRYEWAEGGEPVVILDLGAVIGQVHVPEASIAIAGGTIEGHQVNAGRFTGEARSFPVFYSIAFSPPPQAIGLFADGALAEGEARRGSQIGAYARFDARRVEVSIGLSLLDVEAARRHRPGAFDGVRAAAEAAWREALGAIAIEGGTSAERRIFRTALYHSFLMPTQLSEADGRYLGLDRKVHLADFAYYSDLSLWDTYRTLHPLLALVAPERQRDVAKSLLAMAAQHGAIPRWPLGPNETGTMLGSPGAIVLADTVLREVPGVDARAALEASIADADVVPGRTIRGGFQHCLATGYCPADRMGGSVAKSIEYGWADFAIAKLATRLDERAAGERFTARARMWSAHFDPGTEFLRGRTSSGAFALEPFDPMAFSSDYVEGNAWHYLFAAPFDLPELFRRFGGREKALAKLETFFERAEATPAPVLIEEGHIVGPDPYYWHGNEPDIHAAYLYALAGAPDRGVKWIDWVRRTKYSDAPDGLAGNDDAGTLSAWFVWSALGLYPLAGSDLYLIGTPLFDRATLRTARGSISIERSGTGLYVRGLSIDDRRIEAPWVRHAELTGTLRFEMSEAPTGWGAVEALAP